MENISAALEETLNPIAANRKKAEDALRQMESTQGYIINILNLAVNESSTAVQIRMAAAVALKNFVKRNWGPAPEVEMSQQDEEQFRQLILEATFNTKGNIQDILSNALYIIAKRDYPEKWPDLVMHLAKFLSEDDYNRIVASLATMEQIFRKFRYESKSTALWKELLQCLLSTQEPLTQLLGKVMTVVPKINELGEEEKMQMLKILTFITKVYHSLCSQDIPEYFEDHLNEWVTSLSALLELDVPSITSSAGEPTIIDELKTEICEVFTLYTQRYEEEISSSVAMVIQSIWNLVQRTTVESRYDSMICAALEFLSTASHRQYYNEYFCGEEILQSLTERVCIANLVLRQEDLELFEDEPLDYMKRDIEGTDAGTRRRGAMDFARALCRRFEDKMMPILSSSIQSLLSTNEWIKIDVVYSMVTAIAVKSETAKAGVTATNPLININDFFVAHVLAHLQSDANELPILKADALKFAVTFRNQLAPEHLMTTMQGANSLLSSNTTILHKYAAYAIDKILLQDKNKIFNGQNLPVGSILNNLVAAFDKDAKAQNSPYLIKAILRIIAILDDDTIRHADAIANKLAQLVGMATKNPADSVHTHFLFETICVLVMKTKSVGGSLDQQLLPLIDVIFTEDIEDLIPYALQITGVLISSAAARQAPVDQYYTFLNMLLSERLWARSANVPAALSVLEVLLTINAQKVFAEHSQIILSHMSRLLLSKALDQHGFQLASALLPVIDHCQLKDGSPMSFLLNTMFKRIQSSSTPKFMKNFVVFFCKFTILRNAQNLVQSCEAIQARMFEMIVNRVILPELAKLQNMTTYSDKRIIAIGIGNILQDATQYVGESYGKLATEVAKLLEAASANDRSVLSPEEEQAAMYNAEGEFVNPFCRLSYAPKPAPIAPEITNHKAYFAQAVLVRGPANNQAVLGCIPQDIINHLQATTSN